MNAVGERTRATVVAREVRKSFSAGRGSRRRVVDVLRGVSLRVEPGEMVGIVGPSGSGKSTLLYCLSGLESADAGSIEVMGRQVVRASRTALFKTRRDHVGFIFQSYNLVPSLSAGENVSLPARLAGRPLTTEQTAAVLASVGLEGRAKSRPADMSGGEQQRVAIARALITKPKLVFADEPTGNLDSVSSAEVLGFLKRSVNELGQTIVMVTHDAVAASYADRAIVFADGQIVADEANPTAETMNDLLMAERERATRAAVTSTRADTLARLAGVKDVPNLPITDAPLPPAGRTGTMHHARAAAQHAR